MTMSTTPHQLITSDISSLPERVRQYRKNAREADEVVITITCCDSRVVLPTDLVVLKDASYPDGEKRVLFVALPTIGSGAPSKSRLRGVFAQLEKWGVPDENIRILVTQHGDTEEVARSLAGKRSPDHITCGLRKVFSTLAEELTHIRSQLILWVEPHRQQLQNKRFAPDRVALKYLYDECPEIMRLIDDLHQKTQLPHRLIVRICWRNSDFDLEGNEASVVQRLYVHLGSEEFAHLYPTCRVSVADYDHQQKRLLASSDHAKLSDDASIQLDLQPRTDSHQDPEYVIISFGTQCVPLPPEVLLPSLCDGTTSAPADNAFTTVGSTPDVNIFFCALAEAWYAVHHHVVPHADDPNFQSLKQVVIVCDSDQHEAVIREMLSSTEYNEDFNETFSFMGPVLVVNLGLLEKSDEFSPKIVVLET